MAAGFSYTQATEIAKVFARHKARFLFLGKSGAIILGYPDTTQDADVFVLKSPENGQALLAALKDLGFKLDAERKAQIARGKDFVQLRDGPYDLDLVFAPDGIESFEEADSRKVVVDGIPVCHPDDIIRSKEKAGRIKDKESLPRLRAFRDWWKKQSSR